MLFQVLIVDSIQILETTYYVDNYLSFGNEDSFEGNTCTIYYWNLEMCLFSQQQKPIITKT